MDRLTDCQRFGESGRRNPAEMVAIWEGLNAMLEQAKIRPVIYRTYKGLECVPRALEDLAARKVWGKAIIDLATPKQRQSRI
jgi:NADPH:quinone reductase